MKNLYHLFIAIIALSCSSFSTPLKQELANSHVKFSIKNAGLTVNGQFKSFTTVIKFNKANIKSSIFNGVINVSSIDTDIKKRDNHLKQEEYFNVAKHTGIVFRSTEVSSVNGNTLKVKGNLTIKATTKPVSLDINYVVTGDNTIFTTKLNLNRRDYGVGQKSLIMSDEVNIDVKFSERSSGLK